MTKFRHWGALLAAAAFALPLFSPRARTAEVILRPAEGRDVTGKLTAVSAGEVVVAEAASGSEVRTKIEDVMRLDFKDAKAPKTDDCGLLRTTAGDLVPAKISLGREGRLAVDSPVCGAFEVGTGSVSAIVMPEAAGDAGVKALLGEQGRAKDLLVLGNDQLEGTFEGLTADGVKFNSLLGRMEFKLADVKALLFREIAPAGPREDCHCIAELAGGGRVVGLPERLDGEVLRWNGADGLKLAVKLGAVSAVRVANGRVVFLSELDPEKAEDRHLVEGLPFIWKWRRDVDVFGRPLSLGGRVFERGLGAAAYTSLTYRLDGKYSRFKAQAGICDATAEGGKTEFKVLLDGKQIFSTGASPQSKGSAPTAVDVDVRGGKLLELVVDFGPDGSDLGDIGGWGDARLIK